MRSAGARARIIKEATKLFASKGYANTTTREIARKAGLNISLIKYYFGGKQGLYVTIFREQNARVQQSLHERLLAIKDTKLTKNGFSSTFKELIRIVVDDICENPDIGMMSNREVLEGVPYAKEVLDGPTNQLYTRIAALVEQAKRQGIVRNEIETNSYLLLLNSAIDHYFATYSALKNKLDLIKRAIDPFNERERFLALIEEIYIVGVMK